MTFTNIMIIDRTRFNDCVDHYKTISMLDYVIIREYNNTYSFYKNRSESTQYFYLTEEQLYDKLSEYEKKSKENLL